MCRTCAARQNKNHRRSRSVLQNASLPRATRAGFEYSLGEFADLNSETGAVVDRASRHERTYYGVQSALYGHGRAGDALFPEGNWEDYWLGVPAYTNTRLMDNEGWVLVSSLHSEGRRYEIDSWTPDEDAIVSLMRHDTEMGGGLQGDTPELRRVRSALIARGLLALEWERKFS